jgi:hypothetical protein
MKEPFQLKWYDVALTVAGLCWRMWLAGAYGGWRIQRDKRLPRRSICGWKSGWRHIAVLLVPFLPLCFSQEFRGLPDARVFAGPVGGVDGRGTDRQPFLDVVGQLGGFLGPIPQMLLAIAMVMVLFENERNAVQENALAFSTLGVDPRRLLSRQRPGPQLADFCGEVGGAAAFAPRRLFCFPAVARHLALGTKGLFGGVSGKAAKDAGWRLHRRACLPARRSGHLPESPRTGRAFAGAFGRKVRGLQADAAGGGNHRPDGGEPANARAQLRRAAVSRTRNGACSALRICGC